MIICVLMPLLRGAVDWSVIVAFLPHSDLLHIIRDYVMPGTIFSQYKSIEPFVCHSDYSFH